MKNITKIISTALVIVTLSFSAIAGPKYKANVPASLLTPDSVQSKYLGELTFVDGFPTEETIEKSYDFMDASLAVQLFESGMEQQRR